jgi:thiazole/oxazole-forming peptide maturase SagD family component
VQWQALPEGGAECSTRAGRMVIEGYGTALARLLDGQRDRRAIVRALAPVPAAQVLFAIDRLERAGVIEVRPPFWPLDMPSADAIDDTATVADAWAQFAPYASVLAAPPTWVPLPPGLAVCFAPVADAQGEATAVLAVGRGPDAATALLGCVGEGIERAAIVYDPAGVIARSARRMAAIESAGDVIRPSDLQLYSETQRASGRAPRRLRDDEPLDWLPAVSLRDGRVRWVPLACCVIRYPYPADSPWAPADSTGCAAGVSAADAVTRALLECVERDAAAIWWCNRLPRPAVRLDAMGDAMGNAMGDAMGDAIGGAFIQRVEAALAERGRGLVALDLTTDLRIPVIAAISWRHTDRRRVVVGLGAGLSRASALRTAVGELMQRAVTELTSAPVTSLPDDAYERWLREVSLDEHPQMQPMGAAGDEDAPGSLAEAVRRLVAAGHEPHAVDLAPDALRPPVVRVVVPGLCSLRRQMGARRLFEVPVRLGWRAAEPDERAFERRGFVL